MTFQQVISSKTIKILAAMAVLAGIVISLTVRQDVAATHQPADKVAATGSTIEILRNDGIDPSEVPTGAVPATDTLVVLEAELKTSTPTDLLINVTSECALWTLTKTVDDPADVASSSRAEANVAFFLTVDSDDPTDLSARVPVSTGDESGDVVFCDRAQQLTTQDLEDDDPECSTDDPATPEDESDPCTFVELFQRTRNANGFNWVAFNLGNGLHTIRLWATLNTENTSTGPAGLAETNEAASAAGIGKRTMIIQPVKFPHHVSEVEQSGPTPAP